MSYIIGIVDKNGEEQYYTQQRVNGETLHSFSFHSGSNRVKHYKTESGARAAKTRLRKHLKPEYAKTLFIRSSE